ncbi:MULTISPECIES: bacteriocin [unclassified Granulicatella]|uniref:bacteriocin n=1 Tax=unclassified Granulicatella TaxID=2630493 RepID=UPI00107309DE|nr:MULTISPECIES: bacteriocin [unclassified Granulicatella]MBF0780612.1 bacteriocin [Granulicatella sp. 19428wC4_WM01]TFU94605.1 bacteriocin [Granulicatella sp. WM01]
MTKFKTLINFVQDHKTVIFTAVVVILLCTVYSQFFKAVYDTGNDFGRSIVNAIIK